MAFYDGITNIMNQLVNRRSAVSTNVIRAQALPWEQQRAIFRTGIGSKIVRIKSGYALNDTLQFDSEKDVEIYKAIFEPKIKKATRFMLGFGRGVILIHKLGDDLSKPLVINGSPGDYKFDVFSGDMITVGQVGLDLSNDRYMKPIFYQIRGHQIHHSRVIDFTYVEPTEFDLPAYQYGGISEFELVYNQLINDGVVERASASILEKSSTWVYKVEGYKDAMRSKNDKSIIDYFSKVEDMRSIYGAVLLDATDSVESLSQTLTNLAETDQITLRRLAMVTGIPLALLVGENVKGLNSTGKEERQSYQDMIENVQSEYLIDPIRKLCGMFGIVNIEFKDNQGSTALDRIEYEHKALINAKMMYELGEDYSKYLADRGLIERDKWAEMFPDDEDGGNDQLTLEEQQMMRELMNGGN